MADRNGKSTAQAATRSGVRRPDRAFASGRRVHRDWENCGDRKDAPRPSRRRGVGPDGLTPNVSVGCFDDGAGDAFFGMTSTADPGSQVSLESLEPSSFLEDLSTDVQVCNRSGVIFDGGEFLASGSDGHCDFAQQSSRIGQWIEIQADTSRLGWVSDHIGLDNATVSQFATPKPRPPSGGVPSPAAARLLLGDLGALAGVRARRKA
ncbi:MAG: hypothetical protein AAF192_03055 [Pseudomonadota bacterium]